MAEEAIKRPMKFPYTYTARIAQFPLKFHIKNQWMFRFYGFGLLLSLPVFWKLHNMANSPENIRKVAEKRIKEAAEH